MNSDLNPEAPEFYPNLASVTQRGYATVNKSIRSSNQMPAGPSFDLFKTYTDFNVVTCQLSENVLEQSNRILVAEMPNVKLKRNDNEENTDIIVDANDIMLDRVNVNLDNVSGVNKRADGAGADETTPHISPWNHTPVISKIQMGSTTFIGAKNIVRPQLSFKDPVDNSESLWVPKISDKPNNFKPLALTIIYNDQGEAVGYEHPYKVELDLYQPPEEFLEEGEEPDFPPPLEATPLTYVDTEVGVDALLDHLLTVKEFAIDLEHHSYRSYQGITCLMQISTDEGGDFIVDVIAAREHIHKLNVVFTDPKKLKVFHGANQDILWLQRDFGVYVVGMFDTHQAARMLSLPSLSLKNLLQRYCHIDTDKQYQLADWRMRPLPKELVTYARTDTHYLLHVWRRMRRELLATPRGAHALQAVFENSKRVCAETFNKPVIDNESHLGLYARSKKHFNSRQLSALQLLYRFRDSQARLLDESTMYLLPNHMLMSLAETLPREVQGVTACCCPTPPFVKQNLVAIHGMLLSCRELPIEPQLYRMPACISEMALVPASAHGFHDLAYFPEYSDEQIDLDCMSSMLSNSRGCTPEILAFALPDSDPAERAEQPSEPAASALPAEPVVSRLNVDAKLFIPPYDRYRKYRALAQIEELKEFKEKEAKIAAISKGNDLIKTEVLMKLQEATTRIERGDQPKEASEPGASAAATPDETNKYSATDVDVATGASNQDTKKSQRKRKMSSAKEGDVVKSMQTVDEDKNKTNKQTNVKPFQYKNVDYKKYYHGTNKSHKQPKMNFKKPK